MADENPGNYGMKIHESLKYIISYVGNAIMNIKPLRDVLERESVGFLDTERTESLILDEMIYDGTITLDEGTKVNFRKNLKEAYESLEKITGGIEGAMGLLEGLEEVGRTEEGGTYKARIEQLTQEVEQLKESKEQLKVRAKELVEEAYQKRYESLSELGKVLFPAFEDWGVAKGDIHVTQIINIFSENLDPKELAPLVGKYSIGITPSVTEISTEGEKYRITDMSSLDSLEKKISIEKARKLEDLPWSEYVEIGGDGSITVYGDPDLMIPVLMDDIRSWLQGDEAKDLIPAIHGKNVDEISIYDIFKAGVLRKRYGMSSRKAVGCVLTPGLSNLENWKNLSEEKFKEMIDPKIDENHPAHDLVGGIISENKPYPYNMQGKFIRELLDAAKEGKFDGLI